MLIQQAGVTIPPLGVTCSSTTGTTAQSIALPAVEGGINIIHGIQWSYSTTSTTGRLTATTATSTLLDVDITASGPGAITSYLKSTTSNQTVTVTLASVTGGTGKLNVQWVVHR